MRLPALEIFGAIARANPFQTPFVTNMTQDGAGTGLDLWDVIDGLQQTVRQQPLHVLGGLDDFKD